MRLIDADEVKRQIDEWLDVVGYCTIGKGLSYYGELLGCIDDAPTIEAAPVVHGEWGLTKFLHAFQCSECGYATPFEKTKFCPECGARMAGRAV